jgi:hypothetical protein
MSMETDARWRFVKADDLQDDTVEFDSLDVRSSTTDEHLGSIKGFIVDGANGQLHYVVVDSGGWFTGGSYLIPPAYTRVDAEQQVLWAETSREAIRRFPEFDSTRYATLSADELWGLERTIIEAYGDDPGVVAPSASWERKTWEHYRQPEWWRADYYATRDDAPLGASTLGAPLTAAAYPTDRRDAGPLGRSSARATRRTDSGATADNWPNPAVERAQPGDVLGIERGGETTTLGDTTEDEDQRRESAEKEYRALSREEVRDRAADRRR